MALPTFFIVGAPKSGTTALHHALAQHPEIFMSAVKEPMFFACDGEPAVQPGPIGSFMRRHAIWRRADYLALFAGVRHERAIGEASVLYLRSPIAAERIRSNVAEAKIVVVLRNPVDRAWSHYWFGVANGSEPARTFDAAIAHEMSGARATWFSELHHWGNGLYHDQIARYIDRFGRANVRTYLYEDWQADPAAVLRDLFAFLQVAEDFRPVLRHVNVTTARHSRRLHRWAIRPPRLVRAVRLQGAFRLLDRYNHRKVPLLAAATRQRLTDSYRDDVLKLQTLIGRDLSHWL